ncbi:Dimeric alpha-beta barrel [Pseudoalteromonas sp. JBTF-M23]|uniref:Dimeric alpha-beta barrel n=1 Tax=Pseudoalteromonas caenipelagi TaxID=2726988 RepID=A0A849V773_9GAMM|nr:Dimeric alpha-beta barrel [Pseudoalteromonas caenipelagi]NOU49066.1 Dimeric alpha-beta barrel [Pseudoalteromonas caenipelagi]
MHIFTSLDIESCRKTIAGEGANRVSFVYHLKISDIDGYKTWLNESEHSFSGKRLYRVKADPVAREGMLVDEILIDEFYSVQKGLDFLSTLGGALERFCSEYAILVIKPEPPIVFHLVKWISRLIRLFKGTTDKGTPSANWSAENIAVWPDDKQMEVARAQNLDETLFVYNLNKYKPVAQYSDVNEGSKNVSGKEAYDRYSKIAGFELLRRGAYPVYGGKPICIFSSDKDCMLAQHWDHFIFVRYPQRRNLLATIESEEFNKGEVHRDAGLQRVAICMGKEA